VLLVLLDEHYNVIEIHEADRSAVSDALTAPGSKAQRARTAQRQQIQVDRQEDLADKLSK
jgi:hypothetical protein